MCFTTCEVRLDHLVCELVETNGGIVGHKTGFPIFNQAPTTLKAKENFDKKIEGMKQGAKDEIYRIKPYRGGDDILWLIHSLDN
jgi:hypothetical protein